MGPLKKYVTCMMAFFIQFNFATLCQFYSTTSSVLFTELHQETIEWEKRLFSYMASSVDGVQSTEVEKNIFKHNSIFRQLCIYEQPTLTNL